MSDYNRHLLFEDANHMAEKAAVARQWLSAADSTQVSALLAIERRLAALILTLESIEKHGIGQGEAKS